jgi:hypothetical protein
MIRASRTECPSPGPEACFLFTGRIVPGFPHARFFKKNLDISLNSYIIPQLGGDYEQFAKMLRQGRFVAQERR